MEPKIKNREEKISTTIKFYDGSTKTTEEFIKFYDGSTKTTEEFKAYVDNIDLPVFLYTKVEYRDSNGKIDEDKSFFFRETLCIDDGETSETSEEDSDLESVSESET